jgi:hypothetical protein
MTPHIDAASAIDRRYANNLRYSPIDEWTEKNIIQASAAEREFLLEMQPCFAYRLSLAAVPKLKKRGPEHLLPVQRAVDRLLAADAPTEEYPSLDGQALQWKGSNDRLTRRAWLQRLSDALAHETGCFVAKPTATGSEAPTPGKRAKAVRVAAVTAWYLPELRAGQFQLPHLVTCSSLVHIGVRNSRRRQFGPDAPLHVVEFSGQSYGDTVVTYLGEELRTGDIEVWGQLLKLATPLPLGARVTVSARELLVALGRGTGGPAYKTVRAEIARLQGARLMVRSSFAPMRDQFRAMFPDDPVSNSASRGPVEVAFQLLGPSSTDGNVWSVSVPREVRVAFGVRLSSWFSEHEYGILTRRKHGDTVKRLFLLYRSHAKPWPFTVRELRSYLGSTMGRDSDLKAALDLAHHQLMNAGLIKAWRYGLSDRRRNCSDRTYEVDF